MSTQTITDTDTEAEVIAWLKENRNAQVEGIKEKNLIEERIPVAYTHLRAGLRPGRR